VSTIYSSCNYTLKVANEKYPDAEISLIDLAEVNMVFSDGRNFHDYEGDTKMVAETIMKADAIIIGTPTFQASIPATLKNIFDLLPQNALRDKVVSVFVTAGSSKHYLMAEHQLMPILTYMKAHVVPTYVFIEEVDFHRKEIINDDVLFRIDRLVEDTFVMVDAFARIREVKEAEYGF
jgi:FMN reductase